MKYSSASLEETLVRDQYQKCFELSLRTFKQSEQIRKTTVQQRTALLQDQYSQKFKIELMNKQIRRSLVLNQERMRKISIRNKLINELFLQVKQQIQFTLRSNLNEYKLFLIGIITQGIVRMFEETLLVRCLQEDEKIVESILPECVDSFRSIMDYQLGRQYKLELEVDRSNYLRPLPQHKTSLEKQEEMMYAIGGVILTSRDGSIAYKNTIDCRINILREVALPDVRAEVWEWWKVEEQGREGEWEQEGEQQGEGDKSSVNTFF